MSTLVIENILERMFQEKSYFCNQNFTGLIPVHKRFILFVFFWNISWNLHFDQIPFNWQASKFAAYWEVKDWLVCKEFKEWYFRTLFEWTWYILYNVYVYYMKIYLLFLFIFSSLPFFPGVEHIVLRQFDGVLKL